jgi:hypothetical protein
MRTLFALFLVISLSVSLPAIQKHFELKIKTLQDAPRDPDKLIEIRKQNKRSMKKQKIVKTWIG